MTESGHEKGGPRLAALIAQGLPVRKIAELAGVSARTVQRRLRDKTYMEKIYRIRGEMAAQAIGRTCALLDLGVSTLASLCEHAREDSIKLGAAARLISSFVRLDEHGRLTAKIARIEQILEELTSNETNKSDRQTAEEDRVDSGDAPEECEDD